MWRLWKARRSRRSSNRGRARLVSVIDTQIYPEGSAGPYRARPPSCWALTDEELFRTFDTNSEDYRSIQVGLAIESVRGGAIALAPTEQHSISHLERNLLLVMRFVIGALIGASLAVLLGIPSFTIDREANVEPPLFRVYCDLNQTDYWDFKCVPGAGTAAIILAGAALGALGAAAFRRRRPEQATTGGGALGTARMPSSTRSAGLSDEVDDLVQEAASGLATRIDNHENKSVPYQQTYLLIDQGLRERARVLGIGDLAMRAREAAIGRGVLRREAGVVPQLSRTSKPLEFASEQVESAASSDHAPAPQEHPAKSSRDTDTPTAQASEAPRSAPGLLDELEGLARLHERGLLTHEEFRAAKSRLLSEDTE